MPDIYLYPGEANPDDIELRVPTVLDPAFDAITPGTATLVLATFAPVVSTPLRVTPATRALVLAEFAPTIRLPLKVTPASRALVLSEFAPAVATPLKVTPATRALILAEFAPTVATPRVVTPAKVSLVLTEFAPSVATPRLVTPGVRALALSTFAPSVATPRLVTPGVRALTLATFAPTATVTGGSVTVTPAAAALVLATFAPTVLGVTPALPLDGIPGWRRRLHPPAKQPPAPPIPKRIPVYAQIEPTVIEIEIPEPGVLVAIDNRAVIAALYAAGSIDEGQFTALLAA
jgi:hypothetical protein